MKEIHKTMYPMVLAMLMMGLATYMATTNKLLLLGLYSLGGFGIMLSLALSNVMSLTYIQKEVKGEMLGKVSALSTAVATAGAAIGQLLYGHLIEMNLTLYNILILTFIFSIGVVKFIKRNTRAL
jgi:MFS family permease